MESSHFFLLWTVGAGARHGRPSPGNVTEKKKEKKNKTKLNTPQQQKNSFSKASRQVPIYVIMV